MDFLNNISKMVEIFLLNEKKHKWKLSIVTTELPADTKNSHSWNIRNMLALLGVRNIGKLSFWQIGPAGDRK